MDEYKLLNDDSEYKRFHDIVERFLNPLGATNGIFRPKRGDKKKGDKENLDDKENENYDSTHVYLKDAREMKIMLRRAYFYNNPRKLDSVLLKLDPINRLRQCTTLVNLTNKEVKASFKNLGGPMSGTGHDIVMGYQKKETNMTKLSYQMMTSILMELPAEYCIEMTPDLTETSGFEFYSMGIKIVSMNELLKSIRHALEDARTRLVKGIAKQASALVVRTSSNELFLNVHIYKNFYELRFSLPISRHIVGDELLKVLSPLRPYCYYYAPSILRPNRIKLCIVGTDQKSKIGMANYVNEIRKITSVTELQDDINAFT